MKSSPLYRWLRALNYAVVVIAVIFIYCVLQYFYENTLKTTGNEVPMLIVILVGDLLLGALLGAEQLIQEIRSKGRWSCNVPRLVLLGAPTLLLGLFNPVYVSLIVSVSLPDNFPQFMLAPLFFIFNQIVFAFALVTSFTKTDAEPAAEIAEPEIDTFTEPEVITDSDTEPEALTDHDTEPEADAEAKE